MSGPPPRGVDPAAGSRVLRATADGWEGVAATTYKDEDPAYARFRAVSRCQLVTTASAEPAEVPAGAGFELRVFTIARGGFSSLERHAHPHAVMVLAGEGEVILDHCVEPIGPQDVVVVAPWSWHQFHASRSVALRFLCVVDATRDPPRVATAGELAELARVPALARLLGPLAASTG